MKKTLIAVAVLTLALGATACSSKKDSDASTAATTEATDAAEANAQSPGAGSEEATEESTEEEEVEEDYMTGIVTAIDGDVLTVKSDDDGGEKKYDISKADITREFPFAEGDSVEITFPAESTQDPVPVIALEVMESVIAQNTDPSAEGTVTETGDETITLKMEDGETYTLGSANAYIVAADGITAGKKATVTYIGDLDDEAMAIKIVMEDSYGTPEADIFAFVGEVAQIEDNNIILESADGDFYTFITDGIDLSGYSVGNVVQVEYTGTITGKEIPAVNIGMATGR